MIISQVATRSVAAVCASLLCFLTAAHADENAFVGQWHWSKAQSKMPPDEKAPNDMMVEISRADVKHVRWSMTVKDAQGRPAVESFDAPGNGEFYPISPGTTAAFSVTATTLQATFKGPAGESDVLTCSVSKDGAKLTCNGTVREADGKSADYVDVFDRK